MWNTQALESDLNSVYVFYDVVLKNVVAFNLVALTKELSGKPG